MTLADWIKDILGDLRSLIQAALAIGGVIGGFLLAPHFGVSSSDEKVWLPFGRFIIAMIVGLTFILAQKYKRKRDVKGWASLAVAFFLFAIGSFFFYQYFTSVWTCPHRGESILMGSRYMQGVQIYVAKNPDISCGALLDKFENKVEDVWTKESRDQRRLALAGVYIASVPLFTISIIALLQAIRCVSPGSKSRKKKSSHSLPSSSPTETGERPPPG